MNEKFITLTLHKFKYIRVIECNLYDCHKIDSNIFQGNLFNNKQYIIV